MRPEEWERAESLFETLITLDAQGRQSALYALRVEEPELATLVARLLEADTEPSILDASLTNLAEAALRHDHAGTLVETQIGPYRLLRVLGEGGMGVVYLAQRLDIGGEVAIKLLRDAWMSPMRRQRFQLEQKTLARLNHPNIARIYDAGTLRGETPWFVMEYVDGTPLTAWAAAHHAGLSQRLALIKQVAGAVACAHSSVLVHRDLKPSNILVTPAGEVKLLDFGIVKDLSDTQEGRTTNGLRPLTPGYAAPEQCNGEDTGLFTDVYGMGVLLYELLSGELPRLDAEGFAGKPSRVAPSDNRPDLHLSRAQWNDLNALCGRALQPRPGNRYNSAEAFLQDVEAFEQGRVLAARPAGKWHAVAKFTRRNRLVLSVWVAAVLLLFSTATLAAVRVTRSRNLAVRQLNRMARLQRFTESLFDGGTPAQGPSVQVTTDLLLRRGEMQAESLRDDPELQSAMLATLGGVWQHLGDLLHANVLLERALQVRDPAHHQLPSDADSLSLYTESLVDLGLLRLEQRRMSDAEALLRKAVALAPMRGTLTPVAARALSALGDALATNGKYGEAKALLERAAAADAPGRVDTQAHADIVARLGEVHFYLGQYTQAETLNRQALTTYRRTVGDSHPSVAHVMNTLGHIAYDQGQFASAETNFSQALALDERWYGMDNVLVADDLSALARVYAHTNRAAEARAALERALQIQERVHGRQHTAVATILNDLGIMAYNHDRDDEAERDFNKALAIWKDVYGENHKFVGLEYSNLVGVYMDRKEYPRAEAMARKALAVDAQTVPSDHPDVAVLHVKLGRILLHKGRLNEAESETRQGYEFFGSHPSSEPSYLIGARRDLAAIYIAQHREREVAALQ